MAKKYKRWTRVQNANQLIELKRRSKNNILVTGCAGFIGFHLCRELLSDKTKVVIGIDNLNNYYDVNLKKNRLNLLKVYENFIFKKIDITNKILIKKLFKNHSFKIVVHFAAQAGVRYSIKNPETYFDNNVKGFYNILNSSAVNNVSHFIYASSSSVYGDNSHLPFKENIQTDSPLSFYAATKKSNEVMAYSYSNIYKMKTTGLRFFTMYGPYGRPDMAPYIFLDSITKNKEIKLFNKGNNKRDFTFIVDGVNFVTKIMYNKNKRKLYEIFNVCASQSISTKEFLKYIKLLIGKKPKVKKTSSFLGDSNHTYGDNSKIIKFSNYSKLHNIQKGLEKFINWYIQYNNKP